MTMAEVRLPVSEGSVLDALTGLARHEGSK